MREERAEATARPARRAAAALFASHSARRAPMDGDEAIPESTFQLVALEGLDRRVRPVWLKFTRQVSVCHRIPPQASTRTPVDVRDFVDAPTGL